MKENKALKYLFWFMNKAKKNSLKAQITKLTFIDQQLLHSPALWPGVKDLTSQTLDNKPHKIPFPHP